MGQIGQYVDLDHIEQHGRILVSTDVESFDTADIGLHWFKMTGLAFQIGQTSIL